MHPIPGGSILQPVPAMDGTDMPPPATTTAPFKAPLHIREGAANQYHHRDFEWEDLQKEVETKYNKQQELGRAAAAARQQAAGLAQQLPAQPPTVAAEQQPTAPITEVCGTLVSLDLEQAATVDGNSSPGQPSQPQQQQQQQGAASTFGPSQPAAATIQQQQQQQQGAQPAEAVQGSTTAGSSACISEGAAWDEFYSTVGRTARFFKERRYLLLEFPLLAVKDPQHVVELGCGYGASLLPILRHNPNATVTATDIASTCVAQLRDVAEGARITDRDQRITTFVCDSSDPAALPLFEGLGADVVLIMFTLSAVVPERQASMLRNAWAALRPGGMLCIRDHGLYDMAQLRIPPEQWLGPNMYRRGDNTLAYFFSLQDLTSRVTQAGFEVHECEYATIRNINRRTKQDLKRVFVHGLFRKPAAA